MAVTLAQMLKLYIFSYKNEKIVCSVIAIEAAGTREQFIRAELTPRRLIFLF